MTTTWSLNSTSTLNGAPPVRKNTPSAIFSKSVRAGDGGAGPGSTRATVTVAAPFGCTSADGEVQRRMSTLALHDTGRKPHTAVVLVVGEDDLNGHAAEDAVGRGRLDALHQVLIVDVGAERASASFERDHLDGASSRGAAGHRGRPARKGGLQEAVRRHPDWDDAGFGAAVTDERLHHIARNGAHATLTRRRIERARAAAAWRELDVASDGLLAHRRPGVVDRGDILRELEPRPRPAGRSRLAKQERRAGAGVLDRLQTRDAHRLRRRLDDRRDDGRGSCAQRASDSPLARNAAATSSSLLMSTSSWRWLVPGASRARTGTSRSAGRPDR